MTDLSCVFCQHSRDDTASDFVAELDHSFVLLHFNQITYPGRCLVIYKDHETDILELPRSTREAYEDEVFRVAAAVKKVFNAERINYANLGNVVPHIHTHIIPRSPGDPNDNGPPIFGGGENKHPDREYREIAQRIRQELC